MSTNNITSADALMAYQKAADDDLDAQIAAIIDGIKNADDLDDLLEWVMTAVEPRALGVNDYEARDKLRRRYEMSSQHNIPTSDEWPKFGGKEPEDLDHVWSWDAERLLIGYSWDELRIVDRSDD